MAKLRQLLRKRRGSKGNTTPSAFFQNAAPEASAESAGATFFGPATRHQVQPKLQINQPGDVYEKQADAMAERVVSKGKPVLSTLDSAPKSAQRQGKEEIQRANQPEEIQKMAQPEEEKTVQKMSAPEEPRRKEKEEVQRKPEEEQAVQKKEEEVKCKPEEEKIQTLPSANGAGAAPSGFAANLNRSKGQGSGLGRGALNEMSSAFGRDFSGVRIHTDSHAEQLSEQIRAQAFTHGKDIYFNQGKYSPETQEGKRLLAHELTHVVQQGHTAELSSIQRYTVPDKLPCNGLVGWLNSNSPYAPEWAETRCQYSFNGKLKIRFENLPDGSTQATVSGHPRLSVSKTCPVDSPQWSPSNRPNRQNELAAWNAMKSSLDAHERQHRQIGESERIAMQTRFRAVNFTVVAANRNEVMEQILNRVEVMKAQWTDAAQANQDAIDPFSDAVLNCP